ncbi:MAG: cyclic nucleotide-binding domain-containing protein [Bacteroidota bacterium]|nr:cyclic nucleotide-binding domain-containing protein [Bacteroidota bacterium]MDP4233246.1 cyclic nucleotide-binding domain-containing protein [Bacteroidota bacterium]MDP4242134.1 cyclic nucleotide-binding domain-containing protein [Bacteroidota bacterium]
MSAPFDRLWTSRFVLQALNLRSNERRPVALLWMHSFCLGVGVAYLVSAALPIFLATFPIDYLPIAFASAAVLELIIAYASEHLERTIGQARLLRLELLALVGGTIALRLSMLAGSTIPTYMMAFGLLVWSRIMIYVTDDEFWVIASHLFDVRQGKRLFSLIDSGSFLAKILGYFSVPVILAFFQVPDLLILSAIGAATSLYFLQRIVGDFGHAFATHSAHQSPIANHSQSHKHRMEPGISVLRKRSVMEFVRAHRYIASVALVSFLAVLATTSIDYGFLRQIELRSKDIAEIANFLGLFLGLAQLISLILKIGIVGRLFNRFGLARTSIVLPVGLCAITVAGLIGAMGTKESAMIWSFTAGMLFVQLWSDAVHVPALAIALQPLSKRDRHKGQYLVGGIAEPIGLGVSALLLYVLSVSIGFTLLDISYAIVGVFVAWAFALGWFDREYRMMVFRALKHRRLNEAELVLDHATRLMIVEKLRSMNTTEAEYALRLIPQTESSFFIDILPIVFDHGDRALRIAALQRSEEFTLTPDHQSRLSNTLEHAIRVSQDQPDVLGPILQAYGKIHGGFDNTSVTRWLEDERPQVLEGLLTGLFKSRTMTNLRIANEHLRALMNHPDPARRTSAARIIGRAAVQETNPQLLALLGDENEDVRLAAANASSLIAHQDLVEPLLEQYFNMATSRQFMRGLELCLSAFGSLLIPALARRIESDAVDEARLIRVARLLGHSIRGEDLSMDERAFHELESLLHWPPSRSGDLSNIRLVTLRALLGAVTRLDRTNLGDRSLFDRLIREECDRVYEIAAILSFVDSIRAAPGLSRAARLFRSTLAFEIVRAAERLLLLLGLRYEHHTLLRVRDSLLLGDERDRANAFETLHHILPSEGSKDIIAVLEASLFLSGRAHHGAALADIISMGPIERVPQQLALDRLISNKDRFYGDWTIAIARYWKSSESVASGIAELHHNSTGGELMPLLFERVILLKTVELFRETPDPVIAHIAQALEEVHFKAGENIIQKGEIGDCLYIIVEGRVRVHAGVHFLTELGTRDVVGEMALLDPEPRSASVTAIEETTLLKLQRDVFYDLMADNVEIARGAITTLSRKLRKQNEQISHAGEVAASKPGVDT